MIESIASLFYKLIGNPKTSSLEHRLFSTISFFNGIITLAGSYGYYLLFNSKFLFAMNIVTGIIFLAFYYLSRFKSYYYTLYWPFVFLIVSYLFISMIGNSASSGGTHYYLIPSLVIAMILSRKLRTTVLVIIFHVAVTACMYAVEIYKPEWIIFYTSNEERLLDVSGQFVFVQIFTGFLVLILSRSFHDERMKSERLLLNILPGTIAEELKKTDRVKPMHFDSATVLFTDFVGFTKIAEQMQPSDLVDELDLCFRSFDSIIKKYGLEKIKTIGDAYMAAGGLPLPGKNHAVNCVLASIEIREQMNAFKLQKEKEGKPFWMLRLGINTGPLVAGVIGQEKFAYDVWGDTVNLASRMESSGKEGHINISGSVYNEVKDFFQCEYRGKITAKNKGEVDMYFVAGIHPGLSENNEGKVPGQPFYDLYKKRFNLELQKFQQDKSDEKRKIS